MTVKERLKKQARASEVVVSEDCWEVWCERQTSTGEAGNKHVTVLEGTLQGFGNHWQHCGQQRALVSYTQPLPLSAFCSAWLILPPAAFCRDDPPILSLIYCRDSSNIPSVVWPCNLRDAFRLIDADDCHKPNSQDTCTQIIKWASYIHLKDKSHMHISKCNFTDSYNFQEKEILRKLKK